ASTWRPLSEGRVRGFKPSNRHPLNDSNPGTVLSAWQAENALCDDIALNFRGAAHDRFGPRVEKIAANGPTLDGALTLPDQTVRANHFHRQGLQSLVGFAAEHFFERALYSRLTGS